MIQRADAKVVNAALASSDGSILPRKLMSKSDASLHALVWQNLTVKLLAKREQRTLLAAAAGSAYTGRVLAIIGPSGAGKTTLLQTLGGRLEHSSKLHLSGTVEPINEKPSAFIHQDDAFHGRLTVEETLRFAGALRLPADQLAAHVAHVLLEYSLTEVASSVVGGAKTRGISGGERKRLAIGSALLAADALAPIFADEPTSGLDSFQAQRITASLRSAALNRGHGRMVVLSVHQPSARLLECFDDVVCLGAGGVTLYYGTRSGMIDELERATGLKRPLDLSPAEWALEVASVDPHTGGEHAPRVRARTQVGHGGQARAGQHDHRAHVRTPRAAADCVVWIGGAVPARRAGLAALAVARPTTMVLVAELAAGERLTIAPRDACVRHGCDGARLRYDLATAAAERSLGQGTRRLAAGAVQLCRREHRDESRAHVAGRRVRRRAP